MSNNLEQNDELDNLNNDEKEELLGLEVDLLMQEDIEDFFEETDIVDDRHDVVDDDDEDKESVDNSINFDESESELDVYFKYGTNNHKLDGKHSLKRDTILNGKIVDNSNDIEDDLHYHLNEFDLYETGDIPIEKGSIFEDESKHASDILNKRKLAEDVYHLLKNNTELDFRSNRRKPNKTSFNNYYKMLLVNIDKQYTKIDIFVELAYYFTDNIFNMYKLLDKKYAITIIVELCEKGHLKELKELDFKNN